MDKKALRAQIRAAKRAMTEQQIEETSKALACQLFDHPAWQQTKNLFAYISYNQEVRTMPILEQAWKEGKRVAVPKRAVAALHTAWMQYWLKGGSKNV